MKGFAYHTCSEIEQIDAGRFNEQDFLANCMEELAKHITAINDKLDDYRLTKSLHVSHFIDDNIIFVFPEF